jgi:hypothetical protein
MKPGDVAAVIGADCIVGSPPYADQATNGKRDNRAANLEAAGIDSKAWLGERRCTIGRSEGYGASDGQLSAMPPGSVADCLVSSPPFEASVSHHVDGDSLQPREGDVRTSQRTMTHQVGYGSTPGNVGNDTGETFWAAAREIVQQCFQILRPGGVAIWVCKDFVRKGARVPFSADWLRLCEACGFVKVEWIKASLVKRNEQPGLFGEPVAKTKSRKSFFRRLAEAKGSPAIDHEDVLIVRKHLPLSVDAAADSD